MPDRTTPYPAFNYLVSLGGINDPNSALGGFSDVSGLGTEITIAEYRNGNEPENRVRKIAGPYKTSDVTLKRGIVNSEDFWEWINATRRQGSDAARTDVTISLRSEAGDLVQSWTLIRVVPMKWTGPTLAGKGGGDVAMEEVTLAAEGIEFEQIA